MQHCIVSSLVQLISRLAILPKITSDSRVSIRSLKCEQKSANTNTNKYKLFVRGCWKKCEQNVLFLSISKEILSCNWICAKNSSVVSFSLSNNTKSKTIYRADIQHPDIWLGSSRPITDTSNYHQDGQIFRGGELPPSPPQVLRLWSGYRVHPFRKPFFLKTQKMAKKQTSIAETQIKWQNDKKDGMAKG